MDKDYENFVQRMGSFEMDLEIGESDKDLAHTAISDLEKSDPMKVKKYLEDTYRIK